MEKAAIHAGTIEVAHVAAIAIGQDGFGATGVADVLETGGDGGESFVPGDAGELAGALSTGPLHGVEQALGVVLAIEVAGDFAAKEATGDGMGRVPFEADGLSVFDVDEHGTGIGAI